MRLLRFFLSVSRPFRWSLSGMMLVVLVNSIYINVKPYLVKLLIDSVVIDNFDIIWKLVGIFIALQILNVLTWTFSDWCVMKFTANFRMHITTTLSQKISHYSYTFFQNNLAGSITAKINDAFNLIPAIWFTTNYQFIGFILSTVFTLILLAKIHILFAAGLLIWILIYLIINYLSIKKTIFLSKDSAESKSIIWGHISDYLTNMLGVRLFAASTYEIDYLKMQSQDFIKKYKKLVKFLMIIYVIQGLICAIYSFSFLLLIIHLKKAALISYGDFTLIFMLNFSVTDSLFDLSDKLRDYVTNWGTIDQALGILDVVPEIQDKPDAKPLEVKKGTITFKNVRFHYKGVTALFENTSVIIPAGQKVGLVGYSGSGKSTFVNLILRLYDIASGQILIDDQDIKDVTQDSLRKNIGMIPQDPSLFHRSLIENIRYGRQGATDEEVIESAKRAHANEFIDKLPEKYNSLVGERGVKLSGGQRQRIAIARAILKNAPILILDEATSQLDSLTENYIQGSMQHLMQGKTTIIIAHRLSTLLHMDRILVFDKGKVIEDGTHAELLAKGGLYKTLWITQVEGFLPEKQ